MNRIYDNHLPADGGKLNEERMCSNRKYRYVLCVLRAWRQESGCSSRLIGRAGNGKRESIISESRANTRLFQAMIDASCVYVNASTRFTDGGEFGFGAELGISTQKLHARGPMGIKALTTTKYLIDGDGQVR